MTLRQDMRRLGVLAERIERTHTAWMLAVKERDDLVTDMMLAEVASGVEIGKAANLSQPRTSQIKAATLRRREEERKAAVAEARRAKRRKAKEAATGAAA
jgi:hypothetical protein